jgi:hypothetical protein
MRPQAGFMDMYLTIFKHVHDAPIDIDAVNAQSVICERARRGQTDVAQSQDAE